MTKKPLLMTFALCVAVCLVLAVFVDLADAQGRSGIDKKEAEKKGDKDSERPSKLQMGLGIGSIFVMIAVVKWL